MLERFISAALILCQVTERQGDLFGLITFAQKVLHFVPRATAPRTMDFAATRSMRLSPRSRPRITTSYLVSFGRG